MELDGEPVTADQAATMAVLNYGHFTTMLVDGLRTKGLGLHFDRLIRDGELIFGKAVDLALVRRSLRQVGSRYTEPVMLRATVFDPTLLSDRTPSVLVTSRPAPPSSNAAGIRLRTVDYARELPTVKHLGFFGPLWQRRLAQLAGFDDALFVAGGRVCEGPTWNIAVVVGDELRWPDDDCLPGVTRQLIQHVLDRAAIPWSSRSISAAELTDARAAFITSAGIGVRPVSSIDDAVLPGDPALLQLMQDGYAHLRLEPL